MTVLRFVPLLLVLLSGSTFADSPLWSPVPNALGPVEAKTFKPSTNQWQWRVDTQQLASRFNQPLTSLSITLPLPDGSQLPVTLQEKSVMAPALALKYPAIRTFQSNTAGVVVTYSPSGLQAMYRFAGQWLLLEPPRKGVRENYTIYSRSNAAVMPRTQILEDGLTLPFSAAAKGNISAAKPFGQTIKTYRLAIATSGEYTARFGGINGALTELNSLVSRLNQIFLTDLAVQFELIANNDEIMFTDASTDPYTNDDSNADIEANQQTLDDIIGSANYDLGHLLNTNGGGLAFIGVACNSGFKAQGYTGSNNPQGERFYIDLVAHELGHQLSARHTFNAEGEQSCTGDQRSNSTSVEPGSGTTIMGYAGICGSQNVKNISDPYFHTVSIGQVDSHVRQGGGRSCGTDTDITNQVPGVIVSASNYTVPANTPLKLDGNVSDADGDALLNNWEQTDAGGSLGGTANATEMQSDNGNNPLFRSFAPRSLTYRYLPRLVDVIDGSTVSGETYPTTNRTMTFELTSRDNKGGVNSAEVDITVVDTGLAFSMLTPQQNSLLIGGTTAEITWNSAGTELPPISCSAVDVYLDTDGDNDFTTLIASQVANTGSTEILIPNSPSLNARLLLQCSDNIFYALSPGTFTIVSGSDPIAPQITDQQTISINEDASYSVDFDDLVVEDPDSVYPEGFTLTLRAGASYRLQDNTVMPDADFNGTLIVETSVNDGDNDSNIFPLQISVNEVNDAPVAIDDSVSVEQDSDGVTIDVLANDSDVDGDALSLLSLDYGGSGTVSLENNQIRYVPASGFSGTESLTYVIQDASLEQAIGTLTVTVNATPTRPTPTPAGSSGGSLGSLLALLLLGLGYSGLRTLPGRSNG